MQLWHPRLFKRKVRLRYNVVIIEENEAVGKQICKVIDNYFYELRMVAWETTFHKAVEAVLETQPDIVIMDTVIQKTDILFLLESIIKLNFESIVISNNKTLALRCLKNGARAFLLKPFTDLEMADALHLVLERMAKISDPPNKNAFSLPLDFSNYYIAVPMLSEIDMLDIQSIMYCTAEGRYTMFHLKDGQKKLSGKNLGNYEKSITHPAFFRVHHKYLVNLNFIVKIERKDILLCILEDGTQLPVSTRRYEKLKKYLNLK